MEQMLKMWRTSKSVDVYWYFLQNEDSECSISSKQAGNKLHYILL